MSTIATLTIEMAANIARLQTDMDQAKRVVNDSMKSIEQAVGMAKTAFVAFAGISSVDAFVGMVRGSIEAAAKLHDLAAQTGATVEALSAMGAVGKTSDTSLETISAAMNKLAKNMTGATEDTKIYGPNTPRYARFRQRDDYGGSLWTAAGQRLATLGEDAQQFARGGDLLLQPTEVVMGAGRGLLGDEGLHVRRGLDDLARAVAARVLGDHRGAIDDTHGVHIGDDEQLPAHKEMRH